MSKLGKCPDCPTGSRDKLLIGGKCMEHYQSNTKLLNGQKTAKESKKAERPKAADREKSESKRVMAAFFESLIPKMPGKCMECGKALPRGGGWQTKATMAHILPKRKRFGFPSVACNEKNIVYLCIDHHTNYDNLGADYAKKMKIYPLLRQRVSEMWPLLTDEEKNKVPEHLAP